MRIKTFLLTLLITSVAFSQKPQTFAYVDMEYILQSIPEYQNAQKKLDNKVAQWRKGIEREEREINRLQDLLNNEKILLTEDLIFERQEDIDIKQLNLSKKKARYFGAEGSLFLMRQQLVQPIQDEVYNAIQLVVKKKKYDFVIDRSSDLIILHANPKYDISKLVVSYIVKSQKEIEQEEAKQKKQEAKAKLKKRLEEQKAKREEREKQIIHR